MATHSEQRVGFGLRKQRGWVQPQQPVFRPNHSLSNGLVIGTSGAFRHHINYGSVPTKTRGGVSGPTSARRPRGGKYGGEYFGAQTAGQRQHVVVDFSDNAMGPASAMPNSFIGCTMAALFRCSGTSGSLFGWTGGTPDDRLLLEIGSNNNIKTQIKDGSGSVNSTITTAVGTLIDSQYHLAHAVWWHDGTEYQGEVYIDGALILSQASGTASVFTHTNTSSGTRFGRILSDFDFGMPGTWMWNRRLQSGEVQQHNADPWAMIRPPEVVPVVRRDRTHKNTVVTL